MPDPYRYQYATTGDAERGLTALEEMPVDGPGVAVQMMDILTVMGEWIEARRPAADIPERTRLLGLVERIKRLCYRLGQEHGPALFERPPEAREERPA